MKTIKTIDDVLERLDAIIDHCIATDNRVGAFAGLYRSVTAKVQTDILAGRFEDGPRMEKLDVIFALRFIDAWDDYSNNKTTTASWKLAFDCGSRKDLYHMQNVFLGMNAHINLDLGIAAAATSPGESLDLLRDDFLEINLLLSEMTEVVQAKLARLSPLMAWLDRIARNRDEQIVGFSLINARDHAWNVANLLAPIPPEEWAPIIAGVDKQIVKLGRMIIRPSGYLWKLGFALINILERKNTTEVIRLLRE